MRLLLMLTVAIGSICSVQSMEERGAKSLIARIEGETKSRQVQAEEQNKERDFRVGAADARRERLKTGLAALRDNPSPDLRQDSKFQAALDAAKQRSEGIQEAKPLVEPKTNVSPSNPDTSNDEAVARRLQGEGRTMNAPGPLPQATVNTNRPTAETDEEMAKRLQAVENSRGSGQAAMTVRPTPLQQTMNTSRPPVETDEEMAKRLQAVENSRGSGQAAMTVSPTPPQQTMIPSRPPVETDEAMAARLQAVENSRGGGQPAMENQGGDEFTPPYPMGDEEYSQWLQQKFGQ